MECTARVAARNSCVKVLFTPKHPVPLAILKPIRCYTKNEQPVNRISVATLLKGNFLLLVVSTTSTAWARAVSMLLKPATMLGECSQPQTIAQRQISSMLLYCTTLIYLTLETRAGSTKIVLEACNYRSIPKGRPNETCRASLEVK
jgi:hypothetical protein